MRRQIKSTCARLSTGWSLRDVDDADGEAVREGEGLSLDMSSSCADSLSADSEAVSAHGWLDPSDISVGLFGDVDRLAWIATCWPFAYLCAASTNAAGWE